jgi:hypothetical protein
VAAVEHWVISRLMSDPTVRELVSDRVYPGGRAPQAAPLPYITFRRSATRRAQHTRGGLRDATAIFEVRAWSTSYDQTADAFSSPVRLALGEKREQADGFEIQRSTITDEQDDEEAPFAADDEAVFARLFMLEVVYEETVNTLEG